MTAEGKPQLTGAERLTARRRAERRRAGWLIAGATAVAVGSVGLGVATRSPAAPAGTASAAYHWGYSQTMGPNRAQLLGVNYPLRSAAAASHDCRRFLAGRTHDQPRPRPAALRPWRDAVSGCVDELMGHPERA